MLGVISSFQNSKCELLGYGFKDFDLLFIKDVIHGAAQMKRSQPVVDNLQRKGEVDFVEGFPGRLFKRDLFRYGLNFAGGDRVRHDLRDFTRFILGTDARTMGSQTHLVIDHLVQTDLLNFQDVREHFHDAGHPIR